VGGSTKRRTRRVRAASSQRDARMMRSQRATERRESFRRGDATGCELRRVLGRMAMLQDIAGYWDTRL